MKLTDIHPIILNNSPFLTNLLEIDSEQNIELTEYDHKTITKYFLPTEKITNRFVFCDYNEIFNDRYLGTICITDKLVEELWSDKFINILMFYMLPIDILIDDYIFNGDETHKKCLINNNLDYLIKFILFDKSPELWADICAGHGDIRLLKKSIEYGSKCSSDYYDRGVFEMMGYQKRGIETLKSEDTISIAIKNGDLKCLKFLFENRYIPKCWANGFAAGNFCMAYCKGFRYSKISKKYFKIAYENNSMECYDYLTSQLSLLDTETIFDFPKII
jgi:hypothetical protein